MNDINRVPENGYLVFPISMSRISNAQSGAEIFSFLNFFEKKISHYSLDVIILYTNDLYLNSDSSGLEIRKSSIGKLITHKGELMNFITKSKKYIPKAFHFLPWDYAVINSNGFQEILRKVSDASKINEKFQDAIKSDIQTIGREYTEANVKFILEEIALSYLILNRNVHFPSAISNGDGWRMICYPGNPISSLVAAFKEKILPPIGKESNRFGNSFYNTKDKALVDLI